MLAALGLLHLANYLRFDLHVFTASAEALIERSREVRRAARPGYQSEVLSAMPANPRSGPFLRLDDTYRDAVVRQEPAAQGDGAAPADGRPAGTLLAFELDDAATAGLAVTAGGSTLRVADGLLAVRYVAPDVLVNKRPLSLPRSAIGDLVIRARVDRGTLMTIGWSKGSSPDLQAWREFSFDVQIVADGEFHTYVIDAGKMFQAGLEAEDRLRWIYLQPSNARSATVTLDHIRFATQRAAYLDRPRGTAYETIAKELRRCLYMVPPQTLEYSLEIPEGSPALDFGAGILGDGAVVFEVLVADSGPPQTLYRKVASAARWRDARLDLSPWAGREIALSLRVTGDSDHVALWSNPIVTSAPRNPFNVVMILEDTLRADHLSVYGYRLPTSPFKERLLEKGGVLFENAVSQATKTRPSVPSLMTSLLPTATGVWGFSDALDDAYLTLAEILRAQGFRTASFVQNGNAGPAAGLHQGFGTVLTAEILGRETEGITGDRVTSWIARHRDQNFFVYLHCVDPHGKYDPPEPFDRWYREAAGGGTAVAPDRRWHDPDWVEQPTVEGRRLLYDGEILHNDTVLASLVSRLEELGIHRRTLLVFLSDHGEHLGERGLWEHRPPGFLQVTGVPLMMVYPQRFRESRRIAEAVQLLDVAPTILELAGVDAGNLVLQGDSLVDLVAGRRPRYWRDRIAVSEEPMAMFKGVPSSNLAENVSGSLLFRNWHFISSRRFRPWRLPVALRMRAFDFVADRQETSALTSLLPDLYLKYRYMRTLSLVQAENMGAWRNWTRSSDLREHAVDPQVVEQLKALGYVD